MLSDNTLPVLWPWPSGIAICVLVFPFCLVRLMHGNRSGDTPSADGNRRQCLLSSSYHDCATRRRRWGFSLTNVKKPARKSNWKTIMTACTLYIKGLSSVSSGLSVAMKWSDREPIRSRHDKGSWILTYITLSLLFGSYNKLSFKLSDSFLSLSLSLSQASISQATLQSFILLI